MPGLPANYDTDLSREPEPPRCYCAGTGWIAWPDGDIEPHPFNPSGDDPALRESCRALCDPKGV